MTDRNSKLRWDRRVARATCRAASIAALTLLVGPTADAGSIADWFSSFRSPSVDTVKPEADTRTDGRLMQRWMTREKSPFTTESMESNSVAVGSKGWDMTKVAPDPLSESEFAVAKKHFDAKEYDKAEPILAVMAKRELKKGSPWGEKAQYYLAETQYYRQHFTAANDNYQRLIKKYPGTEYRDQLVRREYDIAQYWLSDEDPKAKRLPFRAYLDGRAPLIDAKGYAIKTLEHVRLHDPQGPLADHAALRTADHYHTVGDYEQAAVFYDQLLAEHAKSPLRERAQLSTIDAKIKGYIGPEYDGSGLASARENIKRTIAEFPEHQANNEQLYHTLDLINEQDAEREYTTGLYYLRALKPTSAEYQFGLVVAKWPRSKWAELAKAQLKKTAKMPRKASVPSRIMTQPGAPDPSSMGGGLGGGGGGMGGMGGGMGGMSSAGSGMGSPY